MWGLRQMAPNVWPEKTGNRGEGPDRWCLDTQPVVQAEHVTDTKEESHTTGVEARSEHSDKQ